MANKYRQIERFVEILDHLIEGSGLKPEQLGLLDGGCGKGYLTFAAFHHLRSRGYDVRAVGVDVRQDVVDKANAVASRVGYDGLRFIRGAIGDLLPQDLGLGQPIDLVVALVRGR